MAYYSVTGTVFVLRKAFHARSLRVPQYVSHIGAQQFVAVSHLEELVQFKGNLFGFLQIEADKGFLQIVTCIFSCQKFHTCSILVFRYQQCRCYISV